MLCAILLIRCRGDASVHLGAQGEASGQARVGGVLRHTTAVPWLYPSYLKHFKAMNQRFHGFILALRAFSALVGEGSGVR